MVGDVDSWMATEEVVCIEVSLRLGAGYGTEVGLGISPYDVVCFVVIVDISVASAMIG